MFALWLLSIRRPQERFFFGFFSFSILWVELNKRHLVPSSFKTHTNDNNIQMKTCIKENSRKYDDVLQVQKVKLKGFLLSLSYLECGRLGFCSVQINKWHEHENINLIYILFISPKNCIWFFVTSENVCNKTHFQTKTFNSKCFPFAINQKFFIASYLVFNNTFFSHDKRIQKNLL